MLDKYTTQHYAEHCPAKTKATHSHIWLARLQLELQDTFLMASFWSDNAMSQKIYFCPELH